MSTKNVKTTIIVHQVRIGCDTTGCIRGNTVAIPAPGLPETEAHGYAAAAATRQGWTVRNSGPDTCPDHS